MMTLNGFQINQELFIVISLFLVLPSRIVYFSSFGYSISDFILACQLNLLLLIFWEGRERITRVWTKGALWIFLLLLFMFGKRDRTSETNFQCTIYTMNDESFTFWASFATIKLYHCPYHYKLSFKCFSCYISVVVV